MIIIRVDTTSGLGHFMRCKWLAVELIARDISVKVLVDSPPPKNLSLEIAPHIIEISRDCTEADDAQACIALFATFDEPITKVIVDSYKLGAVWEAKVAKHCSAIVAIDDMERDHVANMIVDSKWDGVRTSSRYQNIKDKNSVRLLGPDFAMLSPHYKQPHKKDSFEPLIMIALGGGGDWTIMVEVIAQLITRMSAVKVVAVVGKYAKGYGGLETLKDASSQLTIAYHPDSLADYYRHCSLFIGALGTSLYELAATHTPALTFSIANNQQNRQIALDDLGHYFHIDDLMRRPVSDIVNLVKVLLGNAPRIAASRENAVVGVDGLGAKRVADHLLCERPQSAITATTAQTTTPVIKQFAGNIRLRQVMDCDINRYLEARNLATNTWRMTVTKPIDQIEHYCWWFANARVSFVLEEGGEPLLYIWHQLHKFGTDQYLTGGWFSASDNVNFAHAQLMLDWQLNHTAKIHPKAMWLAVINKDNKFVNLLNKRAGFHSIENIPAKMAIIRQLFPKASSSEFNFLGKEAQ